MIKLPLMVLCLGLLAACAIEPNDEAVSAGADDGAEANSDDLQTLWIDSTLADCVGVGPQK